MKRIAQVYDANITNVFHPLVRNSFQIHDFGKNKNDYLKELLFIYSQCKKYSYRRDTFHKKNFIFRK